MTVPAVWLWCLALCLLVWLGIARALEVVFA